MKQKLRLRFSRVLSPFQSCREKNSTAALPPVFCLSPSNPKAFDLEFPTPPPPPRSSPTRRIAAVVSAAGCRSFGEASPIRPVSLSPAVDFGEDDLSRARGTPAYLWRKEEKWHVVACAEEVTSRKKIDSTYENDDDDEYGDDLFPSDFSNMAALRRKREIEKRRRRRDQRKSRQKSRNSTSSVASGSWFSSEDEENDEREDEDNDEDYYDDGDDTDTLLSSRSFSTNSPGIKQRRLRCPSPEPKPAGPLAASPAVLMSKLMPCGAEEGARVKESFAVVKKSEDPRGDFRRSMAEMVVEKGIYDAADLEQLLHCFLSLNSRRHHTAIVSAFADIWEALFPDNSSSPSRFSCQ